MTNLKSYFPSLEGKDLIYLDTAATAQTPQPVIDAITTFYSKARGNPGRSSHKPANQSGDYIWKTAARIKVFFNLLDESMFLEKTVIDEYPTHEVIFTSGTTAAMNMLAQGYPLNKTDTIILTELDHHATIVPWQEAAKKSGAQIKYIPITNGILNMKAAEKLISKGCRVLCLPHISNVTGSVQDVRTLAKLAKKVGASVFVDGAQAVAHIPIDMPSLGIDAYIFSSHKLYGPTGVGALILETSHVKLLSPSMFGGEMIQKVSKDESTYRDTHFKFMTGTLPLAQIAGLKAAIEFFQEHKQEAFENEKQLMDSLIAQLKNIPQVQLHSCERPVGCVSFTVAGAYPGDIANYLDMENICVRVGHHCAQPLHESLGVDRTIRVSLGMYNTQEDIDIFITILKNTIEELTDSTSAAPEELQ